MAYQLLNTSNSQNLLVLRTSALSLTPPSTASPAAVIPPAPTPALAAVEPLEVAPQDTAATEHAGGATTEVIEVHDTPSPPAIPVPSTSAVLFSDMIDVEDTPSPKLRPDSTPCWSPSTFDPIPGTSGSTSNPWKDGVEDFEL